MAEILLSICIPTYNREVYLKAVLDSIIPQIEEGVEIVVNDNQSTDKTMEMLESYGKKHKFIRFGRFPQNMGGDRNYLKVAELAKGKYIWFFSSDDIMEQGAIARMLKEMKEHPEIDVFQINRSVYTYDLKSRIMSGSEFVYSKDEEFKSAEEFMQGKRITYTGYLTALMMRKSMWDRFAAQAEQFIGTAYTHTFVLYAAINAGAKVKGIAQPYIKCRWGEDSFADDLASTEQRTTKRLMLDVAGYDAVSAAAFGKGSEMNKRVNNSVMSYLTLTGIFYSKMKGLGIGYGLRLFKLLLPYYKTYPAFWLKLAPALLIPGPIAKLAYLSRKTALKMLGRSGSSPQKY